MAQFFIEVDGQPHAIVDPEGLDRFSRAHPDSTVRVWNTDGTLAEEFPGDPAQVELSLHLMI